MSVSFRGDSPYELIVSIKPRLRGASEFAIWLGRHASKNEPQS
jgi:hypothetical protein